VGTKRDEEGQVCHLATSKTALLADRDSPVDLGHRCSPAPTGEEAFPPDQATKAQDRRPDPIRHSPGLDWTPGQSGR